MSYDSKIAEVRQFLEDHNQAAGSDGTIDVEAFFRCLKKSGGTTAAMLAECTWEDLKQCGLPQIVARSVANLLRATSSSRGRITLAEAYTLTPSELLPYYDPSDPRGPVAIVLTAKVNDRRCIVFLENSTVVDQPASANLIEELKAGHTERAVFEGRDVYRVGELPPQVAAENPLYPRTALRPGEVCERTNETYQGISPRLRQIMYLAVSETREITLVSPDDARRVIEWAKEASAEDNVHLRYPKAHAMLARLTPLHKAPALVVDLTAKAEGRLNNPFRSSRAS